MIVKEDRRSKRVEFEIASLDTSFETRAESDRSCRCGGEAIQIPGTVRVETYEGKS
jgi:hypothetical protein